jgi:hypothetical protein
MSDEVELKRGRILEPTVAEERAYEARRDQLIYALTKVRKVAAAARRKAREIYWEVPNPRGTWCQQRAVNPAFHAACCEVEKAHADCNAIIERLNR